MKEDDKIKEWKRRCSKEVTEDNLEIASQSLEKEFDENVLNEIIDKIVSSRNPKSKAEGLIEKSKLIHMFAKISKEANQQH